ncbi:protein starmaker isoform X1 [Arabidopsis lyrata subsp. lyrata]|uniref:protein starmaker isoform X1 n=1 Tax=Arabidopsis lyrata subsp. lyrata TaxID=81972 RepID=UPI000A29E9E8|nr:protein starmaker isoform X1 [Arabidopsis lyrata subsp. lyrata]|eukprot:XP_020890190.1 protein starmaker isoform X1 [Arabidopsis lyrata subsp. lyrata]
MMNDEQLSPIGESSVPVPNRMLRRLKKAKSISDLCPGSDGEDLGKSELQSGKGFDGFEEEDGVRSDLKGLGVEDEVTAKKVLDFDSVPEFNQTLEDLGDKAEEDGISDSETRDEIRAVETTEAGKERPISAPEFDGICDLDTEEEIRVSETTKEAGKKRSIPETSDGEGKERKRDKKRNKKSDDFDELPVSTASMNMTKKERREYLDQLRAENQRLLRETRDAAFEPAPLVRKPISSVLEKIRRRKEEISKQFLSRKKSKSIDICDEDDFEEVVAEEKNEESTSKQSHGGQHCSEDSAGPLENSDSPSYKKAESTPTHQDPSLRPQTINSGDELLEKTSSRSLEEAMTPSVVAMNLKLNLSPVPDKSSEETEYRKENSDPETHDSSPGDPVRKFIDEDAEEEDDSDNDLLRFEDEDDDEDEEDDDLRDMIVSQFKEDPTDKDRRNELHQKWLEQQDAAGTEKLLQKLKRGLQHDETLLSEDEDENDDTDDEERAEDADDEEVQKPEASEEGDEDEEDPSHANSMRMTIKKIKEMIPLMFTDEDDVYVSSDDEEMEKKLMQQRLYKKMELKAKSSSSTGDENSEEILRHIKKPEIKKKAKPSSFKERALMEINKNPAASKSSFLGRLTKSSMPEGSRKRGSNVVRGYIFERDDSNSKSSNTVPEEPSAPETIIKEKSRPKRAPAKFTASQSQERSATLQATAVEETSTRQRTNLYEILKMSSKKTCFNSRETMISSNHTESIFAAFKLDKKPVKTNPQVNTLFL